jgi:hypothetical protein
MAKPKNADTVIAKCVLPMRYYNTNIKGESPQHMEIALVERGGIYRLSDLNLLYSSLDATFDLEEIEVLRNLVSCMRLHKVKKIDTEFYIELPPDWVLPEGWQGGEIFETDETLRESKYKFFSCLSFMDSMRIFYK